MVELHDIPGPTTWRESPGIQAALKRRHDSQVFFVDCPRGCGDTLLQWGSAGPEPCEYCGADLTEVAADSINIRSVADILQEECLW